MGAQRVHVFISWLPKVHAFRRDSRPGSLETMAGELDTRSLLLLRLLLLGAESPASPTAIFRHSGVRF